MLSLAAIVGAPRVSAWPPCAWTSTPDCEASRLAPGRVRLQPVYGLLVGWVSIRDVSVFEGICEHILFVIAGRLPESEVVVQQRVTDPK
jgi:hypothetical protein